jgi:hypothetical protein
MIKNSKDRAEKIADEFTHLVAPDWDNEGIERFKKYAINTAEKAYRQGAIDALKIISVSPLSDIIMPEPEPDTSNSGPTQFPNESNESFMGGGL